MSSGNTETRILQMQLENKDFEEGVRQTIKSLENLEEKLDLKNAGNGFEKVSAAANSVQMSHLESGLDTVTNKFTLMGQIGLQVLERISSRIIDTSEKVLRAATIQPMIDGWGEFEMKTNSVQTILGGIRNQFDDQPTAINAISEALDDLNTYADKTIYNFAQMTENVGKFTNQGLGLEESTNAIKGIANWAAAVGANPAQMSRAMYNISQSLGAGSMQLIDWRSIRFANMATPEVKKLFAEVAKVQGVISEDGTVKVGKQVFDVLEDFEASLKGGWLTNEVMAEAFSIYAKAFSETELIEKYGDDLGRQFYEMGVYAEEAATKVRTFSQLLGVLQESLGSGWANTFDILFGGFEQQTEFLTAIKERFEQIINFQTDDRNAWLQSFSNVGGIAVFQDTILKTLDILSDFYWVFNDVAALVLNPFGQSVFNMSDGIFGPRQEGYTELQNTWEGVKGVFDDISDTLTRFRQWLYTPNDSGRSPIHNLANALSGVAGAAGIAWQVLTGFGKMVFRLVKRFAPLVSSVLDLLGQIGGAIYNVFFNLTGQQSIEKIFDKIEGAVGPIISLVSGLASAVIDLIHSFLGIDKAADDWTVLGARMQAFWDLFKYDSNLDFAQNLKKTLKNALIAVFGKDTASSMIQAWDTNIAPILESVSGFFTQAFADMNRLLDGLRSAAAADYSGAESFEEGFDIFLNALLKGAYKEDADGAAEAYSNILGIYESIKTYYDEHVAGYVNDLTDIFTVKLPALNTAISNFLFGYDEVTTDYDLVGKAKPVHHEGIFEKIKGFFGSETWQEDWGQIKGAFEEISGWITSNGEAAWNTILDFLFGKEYDAGDGSKMRYGGAYNAAIEFLNPVWDWIQEKGNLLYDYITTHNFEEMWEDLGHLLFGYDEIIKNNHNLADSKNAFEPLDEIRKQVEEYEKVGSSTTVHHEGLLTPIIEMLRPISEAFEQIKGWALEKISNIDWASIWESIGKFFNGYDEWVWEYNEFEMGTKVQVHHEGAFEKIIGFFDRIIDYFQSPEFQEFLANVKTFYHTSIEPILTWLGGLGGELWGAIQGIFSGQGLGALSGVGTYLTNGINSLIEKLFPKGSEENNGEGLLKTGSFNLLDMISGLFFGTASADEIEKETSERGQAIVATLDQSNEETGGIASALSQLPEHLQSLAGPILAILGTTALNKLLTLVTGRSKTSFLEKISGLLDAIGGIFQGMGILIGAVALSERISPDAIGKAFDNVKALLWNIVGMMGAIGGGSWALDLLGDLGEGGIAALFKQQKPGELDSVGENIANFAEAFKDFMEGVSALIEDVEKIAIFGNFIDLEKGVDRVVDLITRVFMGLGPEAGAGMGLSALMNLANTFLASWADNNIATGMDPKDRTAAATDSFSSTLAGMGALFYSVADGISSILTVSSTLVPLISDKKFANIIQLIETIGGVMTQVVNALDVLSAIQTAGKGMDMISIMGINSKNAQGIIDKKPSSGGSAFLTAIKGIGIATIAVAALELLAGLAMWIIQENIDSYSKTIYRAMAMVKNVLNMINTISPATTSSAQEIVDASGGVLTSVAGWSFTGDPIKNANTFRRMGVDLAIAFEALGRSTSAYESGKLLEALKDLDEAWGYLQLTDEGGFDVADFQGKISFLESAGNGFASMAQSFHGVTQDDVDHLGVVEKYASGLNTISAALAGVSAFNAFTGFNGKSFVETLLEMSRIGHVIKDETGEVRGLEELDGEKIRGYFNEILIALPDDPQLLQKLNGFTAAGGSNIGLFATGLLSLNEALQGYRDIMVELDADWFKSDTNVLNTIDRLGQQMDSDYSFLGDNSAKNMNTRLGIFAADLKTMAGAFGQLLYSTRDEKGQDFDIKTLQDFLTSVNMLGTVVDHVGIPVSTADNFSSFATNFTTIASSVEGLISTIHGFGFSTSELKPVGDFLTQVAGIEQILTGYQEAIPEGGDPSIHDLNEKSAFITKSALWLNEFIPLMSTLGQGLHDMWAPIQGDEFDFTMLNGAGEFLGNLAKFMSADLYTSIQLMTPEQIGSYTTAFGELKQSLLMPESGGNTLASIIQDVMDSAGKNEVRLQITPILDDSNLGGQLPDGLQMENTYSRMITMQMNPNEIQNVRVDASQISELVQANNATRDRIDTLAGAIRNIKIQVNVPSSGSAYGPRARFIEVYPLVANHQSSFADNP